MPKKSLVINKFNGGLNNNALPRDVAPDELVDINNYMVDEIGSIRPMGNFSDTLVTAGEVRDYTPIGNYNLYAYSTDFDDSGGAGPFHQIVYASANASNGMQVITEDDHTDTFNGVLVLGSTTSNQKVVFHNVDGRLYASDSTFTNASTNKVREYIKATYHPYTEGTSSTRSIGAWTDYSNTLTAPSQGASLKYESDPSVASGGIQHAIVRLDGTGTGTWDITNTNTVGEGFDLFYSYVLRDGSETKLKSYTKSSFANDANCQLTFKIWLLHPTNHSSLGTDISNQYKGIRIYWKSYGTIYENTHQLLIDIDFEKGYKIGTSNYYSSNYELFADNTEINNATFDSYVSIGPFANPSEIANVTYEILNGISESDIITTYRYKTAVVANRRVYLGNVNYDSKNHGDRIIKSRVNKFSTFSKTDIVDVTVGDGDEITALEVYADRLLQFKNKKLHIINIAKEFEFLEDTFIGKGCAGPYAVAKTDFGIAWVNASGCYLYDGRRIVNLLEERDGKLIKDSTWEAFVGNLGTSSIGYAPKNRLLIVFRTGISADNDMYAYHLPTGSWVRGDAATTDIKSNFIVTKDNKLAVLDKVASGNITSALIRSWNNASQDHTASTIITKDIDFGNAGTKKHIKKIIVSYQLGSGNLPTLTYDLDGGTTLSSTFASTGVTTNADFKGVEYVPSSPIRNAHSISLKFDGAVDSTFIISDISIIYREKSAR
tara:strand:- start:147 stop:2297 length:2151 start_codon:yes stop_codon:yes gene_type:complete